MSGPSQITSASWVFVVSGDRVSIKSRRGSGRSADPRSSCPKSEYFFAEGGEGSVGYSIFPQRLEPAAPSSPSMGRPEAAAVSGFVTAVLLACLAARAVSAREFARPASAAQQILDVEAALNWNASGKAESAAPEEWSQTLQEEGEPAGGGSSSSSSSSVILRLVHRDSPYATGGSAGSRRERLVQRLKRDAARVESINARVQMAAAGGNASTAQMRPAGGAEQKYAVKDFSSSVVSGLAQGSGEYFTRLGVGTPPRYVYMVMDTGSDIVWLQCLPCSRCYQQADPYFRPEGSSSYKYLPCADPLCRKLDVSGCRGGRRCLYQVSYGDGSFTVGDFSTETLTFRGSAVKQVALGCGHDNEGLFVGASGLLGLGRGALSFPSQTGGLFGRRFSYCLVDRDAAGTSSALIFGASAVPRAAVFTPLLRNPKLDTFYYVELTGISIGGNRLQSVPASAFRLDGTGNGGVIVDSGTSVSRIVAPAYAAMRAAFRAATAGLPSAGGFSLFDTCYDLSGRKTVKVPTVVLHFQNGADVSLPANNYLIPVDNSGVFCFAFAGNSGGPSIIGNIQQQGFRVAFDGLANRVGFAPQACSSS